MWGLTLYHQASPILCWSVAIAASAAAAVTDLRQGLIPNRLTLPVLLAGLIHAFLIADAPGLGEALVAAILLALPYVILFLMASGGAGDAKLMAAIGAWLGIAYGLAALVAVAICGGLLGLVLAAWRGRLPLLLWDLWARLAMVATTGRKPALALTGSSSDSTHMQTMPYGIAVFAGVVTAATALLLWRG